MLLFSPNDTPSMVEAESGGSGRVDEVHSDEFLKALDDVGLLWSTPQQYCVEVMLERTH